MAGHEALTSNQPKRKRNENQSSWKRKNRQRFGRASSSEVRRDLPHGSRGFLITCDPKHEHQCFREAVVLIGEQVEALVPDLQSSFSVGTKTERPASKDLEEHLSTDESNIRIIGAAPESSPNRPQSENSSLKETRILQSEVLALKSTPDVSTAKHVSDELEAEVDALRENQQPVFTRIDWGVQGSVFLKCSDQRINVEETVEAVLCHARASKTPSCRSCVRFIPVHYTCYAKAEDAAVGASRVITHRFPSGKYNYSIVYRSRMNTDAHREDFIKSVAAAIENIEVGRFKVCLEKPDFVVIVEVVKTVCCLGIFSKFYELAKLNIREVSKPDDAKEKQTQPPAHSQEHENSTVIAEEP